MTPASLGLAQIMDVCLSLVCYDSPRANRLELAGSMAGDAAEVALQSTSAGTRYATIENFQRGASVCFPRMRIPESINGC